MLDRTNRYLVIKPLPEDKFPYLNKKLNEVFPVGSVIQLKKEDEVFIPSIDDRPISILPSEKRECLRKLKSAS